mgnify:CR=1 FL=1
MFPISRDPPEGGTTPKQGPPRIAIEKFPISRDPPEGGTPLPVNNPAARLGAVSNF